MLLKLILKSIVASNEMIGSVSFLLLEYLRLEREQWIPEEHLEDLQWERFKKILNHAYHNTEFYKKRFEDAGFTPEDIKNRNDLENVPILTRDDLRRPEKLIAQGFNKNKMNSSTTSGSTGQRTTTYFDKKAWLKGKFLLKLRARIACGLTPLDKLAVFTEEKPKNSFLKALFLRQSFFSIFDPVEKHLPDIEEYNPSAMYGFPSYFTLLSDRKTSRIDPSIIFTSSEMLDLKTREKIESSFNAKVFDIYGCTEVKEIGWECLDRSGHHINGDWLLVEFLKNGKASLEKDASIVVTSLYNYGMPLIRYKLGDTGRILKRKCPCGRGLPIMTPALGRSVDYFILPDYSMISPYAMTIAIENIEEMKQYQIIQEREDLVIVKVVPNKKFSRNHELDIKSALKRVLTGVIVEVNLVEEIGREKSGKYRVVISKVKNTRSKPSPL